MKRHILLGAFVALSALTATFMASPSHAQAGEAKPLELPSASPAASLKQRVGLTDVELEYSRPSMKGRKIFGGLVPYGEIWRTGANAATKVTFSGDVKFGGQAVPAGSYALVTLPTASEWTVILSKVVGQWGSYAYDQKNDLVRVSVKPVALADAVETMTISVLAVRDDSAVLAIDWDKTRIPVKIEIDLVGKLVPQIKAAMAADGKKPYLAAAMFYYEHNLDLKQAAAWIEEARKEQPGAVWVVYRKGLILAKLGDKEGAFAAAQQALELAEKQGGSLGTEYKRLSEELIASLD
ncbi:MAG: DUF2911 domain-containing protein [Planctomycetota bacterium]